MGKKGRLRGEEGARKGRGCMGHEAGVIMRRREEIRAGNVTDHIADVSGNTAHVGSNILQPLRRC